MEGRRDDKRADRLKKRKTGGGKEEELFEEEEGERRKRRSVMWRKRRKKKLRKWGLKKRRMRRIKACDAWIGPFVLSGSRRKSADGAAEQVVASSSAVDVVAVDIFPRVAMDAG